MSPLRCRAALLAAGLALMVVGTVWADTPWTAPDLAKSKKNPIAANSKVAVQGKKLAQTNCASCHGTTGTGNGPAAVALNPKPADWTSKKTQEATDGEIYWKITTGRGSMPSWKHLPETDRWAIVQYIRTLRK